MSGAGARGESTLEVGLLADERADLRLEVFDHRRERLARRAAGAFGVALRVELDELFVHALDRLARGGEFVFD